MTKTSKMTVAALVTALSLGGLTAFAMGVSKIASGDSASSLSGDSAKAKVIRIRKVKKVPAPGAVPVSSSSGYSYGTSSYASTGSAPSVQSPDKGASSVRPPSQTDQGGWDDDGGQEFEDHEGGEGQDD